MSDPKDPRIDDFGKGADAKSDDDLNQPLLDDAAFADLLSNGMPDSEVRAKRHSRYRLWRQLQKRFPEHVGSNGVFKLSGREKGLWLSVFIGGSLAAMAAGAVIAILMMPEFPAELGIEHGVGLAIELKPFYLESGEEINGTEVDPQRTFGFRVFANHEGYAALFIAEESGPPSVIWEQQRLLANEQVIIGDEDQPFNYSLSAVDQPTRICAVSADSPSRLKTFVSSLEGARTRRLAESCLTMRVAR